VSRIAPGWRAPRLVTATVLYVDTMKFGIFYEHQLPRPWADDSEQQLINDALEQVELADKLGFDVVWEVEHHFLEEYSHSAAPEVFLAACSQRAPNIRLGHGIVQTPPPFNHPARVAERIAMLDLVSNGRVEFGTGESSSEAELGGFRIDPTLKREMWQEGLEVAVRCLTETPFGGVDGKYVKMPPRNVVPKPVQKPHPPLWVACSRRDTIHLAAQKGIGALTFAFIDPEEAQHWLGDYYTTLENECVPIGKAINPNIACVTTFMCAPTEEVAIARGIEGANFFGYSLAHFYVFGEHVPGQTDVWAEYLQKRDEVGYSAEVAAAAEQDRLGAKIAQDGVTGLRGAIGSPDQIREYLRRYEEVGVDQIIFVSQAGKNKHEHIMESLELFGREVLPEFIDRDAAQVKAKAARVEPLIEKAMARKVDDAPRMPADYVMPAMPKAFADKTGDENIRKMLTKIQEDRAAGRRDDSLGIIGGN
jgi:alkanesulfonate monooxygenase SsuD/methylene tetrahydromethanopterin reductase-like flavin-dependent oxidoreductase (luciferase family)